MNTNNEAIGKLSNGENVFMRRTGKNSYEYVDGNGDGIDGRRVKKFSKNINLKGDTSVEKEKMKKKATELPDVSQIPAASAPQALHHRLALAHVLRMPRFPAC